MSKVFRVGSFPIIGLARVASRRAVRTSRMINPNAPVLDDLAAKTRNRRKPISDAAIAPAAPPHPSRLAGARTCG
jgi:hypothetical protein